MPLTIIAGRAGSGKSAVIYERINELGRAGINAVLLVPEQFTLQAERELIESGNGRGFMTVKRHEYDAAYVGCNVYSARAS